MPSFTNTVRAMFARAQAIYILGGILLPAGGSLLLERLIELTPKWAIGIVVAWAIICFFLYSLHQDRERARLISQRSASLKSIDPEKRKEITDILVLANLQQAPPEKTNKRRDQSLHTILRTLPNVKALHAIAGEDNKFIRINGPSAKDRQTISQFKKEAGRDDVNCDVRRLLPAGDFEPSSIPELTKMMCGLKDSLGPERRLAVDITGGSKPMTITCYLAAIAADLPITYTVTDQNLEFLDLISLNDPDRILEVGIK